VLLKTTAHAFKFLQGTLNRCIINAFIGRHRDGSKRVIAVPVIATMIL